MADYFKSSGFKQAVKNDDEFTCDEGKLDSVLNYFADMRQVLLNRADHWFPEMEQWFELLFRGFNVMVAGTQSKRHILEKFEADFLSGFVPDLNKLDSDANLNVTVFKIYGFSPPTIEGFVHQIFEIIENRRHNDSDIETFLDRLDEDDRHCVFIIHSIDSLLQKSKKVWQLILDLYERREERIHIVASEDHEHCDKKIIHLRRRLKMALFWVAGTDSHIEEKICLQGAFDQVTNGRALNTQDNEVFSREVDLQRLKDIYTALQPKSKWILLYILRDLVTRSTISKAETKNENLISESSRKRRQSTKSQAKRGHSDNLLSVNDLLAACQREFITYRLTVLKDNLKELVDHSLISLDESEKNITYLVSEVTSKMMLDHIAASNE